MNDVEYITGPMSSPSICRSKKPILNITKKFFTTDTEPCLKTEFEMQEWYHGTGLPPAELAPFGGRRAVLAMCLRAATATADFHLANTPSDGIPYWDTGAPGLARMPRWRVCASRPDNPHEPVDSSAAAIAAQVSL